MRAALENKRNFDVGAKVGLTTAEKVRQAVGILRDRGWIKPLKSPQATREEADRPSSCGSIPSSHSRKCLALFRWTKAIQVLQFGEMTGFLTASLGPPKPPKPVLEALAPGKSSRILDLHEDIACIRKRGFGEMKQRPGAALSEPLSG
jgi:hypothetical protein